jgi:hypothetical protein
VQCDIWNPYDPIGDESPEDRAHLRKRLRRDRELVRAVLPPLREKIENLRRDSNSVFEVLRPYYYRSDPDDSVRRVVRRYLREPWVQSYDVDEDVARYEG